MKEYLFRTLAVSWISSLASKFSFSQKRNGYIAGRFYTLGSEKYFGGEAHDLSIALFDDDAWERFHAAFAQGTLCNDRRALATWTHHIKPATTDDPHGQEPGGGSWIAPFFFSPSLFAFFF